uniref:Uncharacterized protein n=1 Tax=Cannabis sativa TaxID=3483 RepID=A0A803QB25_CANSA
MVFRHQQSLAVENGSHHRTPRRSLESRPPRPSSGFKPRALSFLKLSFVVRSSLRAVGIETFGSNLVVFESH